MKTQTKPLFWYLAIQFSYLVFFLWWIFNFPVIAQWLKPWLKGGANVIQRSSLWELTIQHLWIVVIATGLALIIGFVTGSLIHYYRNYPLKTLALQLAAIGETVPSMVVIALCVPILGYGDYPIIIALLLYAILPILRNTIVGLESIPPLINEAAIGVGYSRFQQLMLIDLPLAKPIIMAGIRTALIINISAATIGATVGAGGFGVLIISGIRTHNQLMVVQGSVPVILIALFVDRLFRIKIR